MMARLTNKMEVGPLQKLPSASSRCLGSLDCCSIATPLASRIIHYHTCTDKSHGSISSSLNTYHPTRRHSCKLILDVDEAVLSAPGHRAQLPLLTLAACPVLACPVLTQVNKCCNWQ